MPETLKILVVDDEPSVREAIALILESPGYFIRTAVNGEEALAICQTEKFDLVLSDMRMPGMNGQELLKRLRALDSRQKVMLVTAFPSTETQGGFDAVIIKPFTVRELRSRVSELLSKDHTVSHVYREPRLKAGRSRRSGLGKRWGVSSATITSLIRSRRVTFIPWAPSLPISRNR